MSSVKINACFNIKMYNSIFYNNISKDSTHTVLPNYDELVNT